MKACDHLQRESLFSCRLFVTTASADPFYAGPTGFAGEFFSLPRTEQIHHITPQSKLGPDAEENPY